MRLTETEVQLLLGEANGWKLTDERWIVKKYRFQDYLQGIEFVRQIAVISENANHHPFISIDYKLITVKGEGKRQAGAETVLATDIVRSMRASLS